MYMMRSILVLCLLVAAVYARTEATYDSRYDNFDAESVAGNVRLLKGYGHCFLGTGPCTAEGNDFKKTIPDALRTNCSRCTPKQRHLIRIVVKGFQTKTPDLWAKLTKKEDPNGEYREIIQRFLNSSD